MVPMFKYMGAVLLALFIQCCGVYQILLALLYKTQSTAFPQEIRSGYGLCVLDRNLQCHYPDEYRYAGGKNRRQPSRISSFTIPLGATINMDGTSIMQGVAVVFVAQAFGIQLSPADYLTLLSQPQRSPPSVPQACRRLVWLRWQWYSIRSVCRLPGIGLIMGIDRILDMARTAVNITGDAICTTIVAHQDGALDKSVFNKN